MIHEATLTDRPHFMRLYSEFQKSQSEKGSHFLPSIHNLNLSKGMFESYAMGKTEGFTLLWTPKDKESPVALLLAGMELLPSPWELDLGKTAILWAVYVEPEYRGQGITMKLFQKARELGIGIGIETIITYVLEGNSHGDRVATAFGTRPMLSEHHIKLLDGMSTKESLDGLQKETT